MGPKTNWSEGLWGFGAWGVGFRDQRKDCLGLGEMARMECGAYYQKEIKQINEEGEGLQCSNSW